MFEPSIGKAIAGQTRKPGNHLPTVMRQHHRSSKALTSSLPLGVPLANTRSLVGRASGLGSRAPLQFLGESSVGTAHLARYAVKAGSEMTPAGFPLRPLTGFLSAA